MSFKKKTFGFALLIFSILQIWFILSWSNYWYGGGFGHRGFTEYQGVLAIPFAVFVEGILTQRKQLLKVIGSVLIILFTLVGLIRIVQYDNAIWGKPNMSTKYALENYLQINPKAVDYSTLHPAARGDKAFIDRVNGNINVFDSEIIYLQDFEHLKSGNVVIQNDNRALEMKPEMTFFSAKKFLYNNINPKPGDGIKISFDVKPTIGSQNAFLVFEIMDRKQKTRYHYTSIPIDLSGVSGEWKTLSTFKELPDIRFDTDIVSLYLYNPNKSSFFIDNINLRLYKFQR